MNTSPSRLRLMITGFFGSVSSAARDFGRSSGTPTVNSGAVTIKMTSNTSITSTIGVTLISASGAYRSSPASPDGGSDRATAPPPRGSGEQTARAADQSLHPAGKSAEIDRDLVVRD